MDASANPRLFLSSSLSPLKLRAAGFAPRHLSRSAALRVAWIKRRSSRRLFVGRLHGLLYASLNSLVVIGKAWAETLRITLP